MEKQIAAVFEIAEIQAQGTRDKRWRHRPVPPCSPGMPAIRGECAEGLRGDRVRQRLQIQHLPSVSLRGHVNFPPRRSGNRRKGLFM